MSVAPSASPSPLPPPSCADEIDKAFSGTHTTFSDAGTTARVRHVPTWLSEKTAPVFVAATANRIDQLPPELLRKGRFDEIFFVTPGYGGTREIFASPRKRGRDRGV
jgi:SpoVK/Ycf46/Vps4 family AAA+-type ATPase